MSNCSSGCANNLRKLLIIITFNWSLALDKSIGNVSSFIGFLLFPLAKIGIYTDNTYYQAQIVFNLMSYDHGDK